MCHAFRHDDWLACQMRMVIHQHSTTPMPIRRIVIRCLDDHHDGSFDGTRPTFHHSTPMVVASEYSENPDSKDPNIDVASIIGSMSNRCQSDDFRFQERAWTGAYDNVGRQHRQYQIPLQTRAPTCYVHQHCLYPKRQAKLFYNSNSIS